MSDSGRGSGDSGGIGGVGKSDVSNCGDYVGGHGDGDGGGDVDGSADGVGGNVVVIYLKF